MPHGHSAGRAGRNRLVAVFLVTSVVLVVEVIGGLASNSLALLADAGHMLTDVVGIGLALGAIWIAGRAPSRSRSFGYHRLEILAAVVNAVLLFGVADGRLQPELSADGQLQTAAWTDAYALPSEPWVFVIDGAGKVVAKFETILSPDEVRAALDAIASSAAEGVVTAVDQSSLTDVRGFTLRTDTGAKITFSIGTLELIDGAFPANHLREHMATASRVKVTFEAQGVERIATRLTDAE